VSLYEYIAERGSPVIAARYAEAIVAYCESLATLPHRGTKRDDSRAGLRIANYKRRAVIAFAIDEATDMVAILGLFYGGRDYERVLVDDDDNELPGPAEVTRRTINRGVMNCAREADRAQEGAIERLGRASSPPDQSPVSLGTRVEPVGALHAHAFCVMRPICQRGAIVRVYQCRAPAGWRLDTRTPLRSLLR